jgi:hypothetical protein
MNVEELAKRRTELNQRLEGYRMTNIWGASLDDRIDLEARIIKTQRELVLTERMIDSFVHAEESQ